MSDLKKNLIVAGVFSAQTPDTSGEVLDVKGADIEELKSGKALVNTEHINPEDLKDKDNKGFEGFQSIVGRVMNAKKIFSEKDCSNKQELQAFKKLKVPLIWGQVEIFDDADHPNAKAAASIIRNFEQAGVEQQLGFSVEGSTVKREGNLLKETAIRRLALTHKPCNRAAKVEFVQDSHQGVRKSMDTTTAIGSYEPLHKSAYNEVYIIQDSVQPDKYAQLSNALSGLKKAISAGGMGAAPSALSSGPALQKEGLDTELAKLVKIFKKRKLTRTEMRKHLPTLSEEHLEKVEAVLAHKLYAENEAEAVEIYEKLNNSIKH